MEPDPAAVVREYDRLAPRYDRRWSGYIAASTDHTARRVDLRAGERLLDVGCGTGALLARLAADRADTFAGVDPSTEMLAVARSKLGGRIDLRQAAAESLPFGDGAFDVVASNSAFHYFARPAEALAEMRRVLRPGGRLVITDWCDDFLACRLCDCWLRWVDAAHARTFGSARCRELLASAGLAEVRVERYKISWLWGLMTAQANKP